MLKKLIPALLTAGLALAGQLASAQTSPNPANWCGTTVETQRYFAEHPGAQQAQEAFYQRMAALPAPQQRSTTALPDVTIPLVVHVIHAGGADNISDAQINSAVAQLNLDYQKLNPDTAAIIPLFRPIAANVGYQFRLAKIDPNGNCTTGITRHYNPTLANDARDGTSQALVLWNPARYMNIWVVATMGGGAAGYVVPPNVPTNTRDGFTVLSSYFGTIGTSSLFRGRAATHEIGHYFGLSHPWGATNNPGTGDCTGTDNVADTPTTDGSTTCNLSYAPCGPIANVQNFMDYSYCFVMFTQGQRALMRNILAANRSQLVSQANLISTGTNDGYVATTCAPVPAFLPSVTKVCEGSTVTFRDYSYNFAQGSALTYSWSFPGGTPATSTSANPTVTYSTSGIYSVTETVTSAGNSGTTTSTNLIMVQGANGGETAPLFESFETSSFPDNYPAPSLRNYTNYGTSSTGVVSTSNVSRWRRVASVPVPDGSACLVVTNSSLAASYTATLITPNINLSGITQPVLRFQRAYALRSASPTEVLIVSFSTDCGVSWNNSLLYQGTDLTTMGTTPQSSFAPSSVADWQPLTIPIPAVYQGSGRFQVKFEMVNGITAANNFFMDAMSVSSALATHAASLAQRGISVYPNPLTNETAVHVALKASTQVQVSLTDMLGRQVLSLPAKTYGAGNQTINLPTTGTPLRAGIYVVRIALDGETYSTKLTVE